MNLGPDDHRSNACRPFSEPYESYEPSIDSSAPSSQLSVFSDSSSAQSSIASSISDDFRLSQDDVLERDRICAQAQIRYQAQHKVQSEEPSVIGRLIEENYVQPTLSYADVTSATAGQRLHQKRCPPSEEQRPPPPLVRQRDRKVNFVDNLVDSAAQMIEVIWPLSVVPCNTEGASKSGVLPLRIYIEETLRRSRTSYSTLQVALYYLILVKPYVPRNDFTMAQEIDCSATRALICGRRMFLAALILASKYLQDRNYSAKAWSKMSGLRVHEINANERVFLGKIDWRLHIPKPLFETWQEVVLRYTSQPLSPAFGLCGSMWKSIVPLLTPELDSLPFGPSALKVSTDSPAMPDLPSPITPTPPRASLHTFPAESGSQETTPTPATILPRFLEPTPDIAPPTPPLARMGPLPTPQMTPSSVTSSTPAVSTCGSRRTSMCSAMSFANKMAFNRCVMDVCQSSLARRPSIMSASSGSSLESMLSDNSRASRASSVSSVSTVSTNSSCAPNRASLARLATCRNVRLPLPDSVREEKENGENRSPKPIIVDHDVEMVSSPDVVDFTVSEKAMHAPHRHSKHAPHVRPAVAAAATSDKCRKRSRPRNRRSELQEEVRFAMQEFDVDGMDLDDDEIVGSPSPAANLARSMLAGRDPGHSSFRETHFRETQPPATLSRAQSSRVPVLSYDGKKRACLSAFHEMTNDARQVYYGAVHAR